MKKPTSEGPEGPDLDAMLKRLHLPTVRRLWSELALRAEIEDMSYRTYLEILISEEIAHRAQTRITRSVRAAHFLIGELSHAARLGSTEEALEPYLHPHVLVIDELGYLSHVEDAANVLYRVVNERYLRHRPILLTTNKPLAALGRVLHDGDLAEAILDRLLERGAYFPMRGRSYRTRHLKDPPKDNQNEDSAA